MKLNYRYVTAADELGSIANQIAAAKVIGADTETLGFDPYTGKVRLLSLNIDGNCYVIDLFQTKTIHPLDTALNRTEAVLVLQNAKFDQKWLWHHYKIKFNKLFDTMRASYLIYNGLSTAKKHDLWSLYDRELDLDPSTPDLGGSDWSGSLSKEQLDYAAEDITLLPRLREILRKKLIELGMSRIGLIEMQAVYAEARMELAGFRLDAKMWLEQAEETAKREYALRLELLHELPSPSRQGDLFSKDKLEVPFLGLREGWEAKKYHHPTQPYPEDAGEELPEDDDTFYAQLFRDYKKTKFKKTREDYFNIESSAQILAALRRMELRDETGRLIPSTSELVLAGFAKDHLVVRKLLKHREYATRLKMFGADYLKFIHPITGRIHGSLFAFTGAGRYSMTKPNLLQLPRDKAYRSCFRPKSGRKLVLADFSQIELRGMAQLTRDPALIAAYAEGRDVHKQTAAAVTGIDLNTVSAARLKELRQLAKAVNFGLIYSLGAAKFVLYAQASYGVTITLKEAELIIRKYFELYKGVKKWQQDVFRYIKPRGKTSTILGRLRYLDPQFNHGSYLNTPCQGSCADGLKLTLPLLMNLLDTKYAGRVEFVLSVHDEIILEADDDPILLQELKKDLEQCMVEGMSEVITVVPVVAEGAIGQSWAEKG